MAKTTKDFFSSKAKIHVAQEIYLHVHHMAVGGIELTVYIQEIG